MKAAFASANANRNQILIKPGTHNVILDESIDISLYYLAYNYSSDSDPILSNTLSNYITVKPYYCTYEGETDCAQTTDVKPVTIHIVKKTFF